MAGLDKLASMARYMHQFSNAADTAKGPGSGSIDEPSSITTRRRYPVRWHPPRTGDVGPAYFSGDFDPGFERPPPVDPNVDMGSTDVDTRASAAREWLIPDFDDPYQQRLRQLLRAGKRVRRGPNFR